MKKLIDSYISFTRTERNGIIALCSLLLILLALRASMHLWVRPGGNIEDEKKLATAWETYSRQQAGDDTTPTVLQRQEHADNGALLPDTIDINTADSSTLVQLKGIGPATASKILAWRKKHGGFTDIEQLKETGSFSPEIFALLKAHLIIQAPNAAK